MNIGFDAKRLFNNISGLGNYSRNIVSYLQEFYPDNKYFLFTPSQRENIKFTLNKSTEIIMPQNDTFFKNKSLWRTKGILKDEKFKQLDIFQGLSNELPVGISKTKIKSILTVHDLIFIRFPELYKFFDRKIYTLKMKQSCKEADKIIAISNQTKNDLINFLNIDENKIKTVYQGCNEIYKSTVNQEVKNSIKEKYNLPENFILNVGTIEARKNALLIVKALLLKKINIPLVIVGRETSYTEKIHKFVTENKMKNQVIIINNVDFQDLPALYQMAEIFIYPSFFEGFGIPIIEAFNSSTPVITSDIAIFKEVGNDTILYFENNNVENLAEKILLLLENKTKQQEYIKLGNERAKFFEGKKIADDLMKIYKTI